jgi:hypothetical protein
MDKLKTLLPSTWQLVESQADRLYNSISNVLKDGGNRLLINYKLYDINKLILEQNGFKIINGDDCATFRLADGHTYTTIRW